ncbi:MAG: leucine-rich repeat domain-containing protein [Clostridia bacterium]|nr:leucine-rich repeat domain-containing protein [Clostridia bacterium]
MVSYNDATDEVVAKKSDIRDVEMAAYIALSSVKEVTAQDDFSFPDGLANRVVEATTLGNSRLLAHKRSVCNRTLTPIDENSIIAYGKYVYAGYNGLTKDFVIPSRVTNIGVGCFREATVDSITFKGQIYSLNEGLFYHSNAKTITFEKNLSQPTMVSASIFEGCASLRELTLPPNLQKIGERMFYNCASLQSIDIPNAAGEIGEHAFCICVGLKSFNIAAGVTKVGENAFYNCVTMHTLTIAPLSQMTEIGNYAFYGCSKLESFTFEGGSSLTTIGQYAFRNCTSLESVSIPSTVTSIGSNAFNGCTALTEMRIYATTPPTLGATNAIPYQNTDLKIYIPAGTLSAYQAATYWKSTSIKNKLIEMEA